MPLDAGQIELELRCLEGHRAAADSPAGVGLVRFVISGPEPARVVIERAASVLRVVDQQSRRWPEMERWKQVLPSWFVARCAPEQSKEQTDEWLARWRSLSPREQQAEEERQPWSLLDWLHWLHPDRREWLWWDSAVYRDAGSALVVLAVQSWPFPWGAFRWLLQAAGADQVEAEPTYEVRES